MASVIVESTRLLRRNQTFPEKVFWEGVRDRRFLNKKFSRQFPIGVFVDGKRRFFIADFYCHEHKLIVEIDGAVHNEQKEYDDFRTELLNEMGMRVVRFSNREVVGNLPKVLQSLRQQIQHFPSLEERG